MKGQFGDVMKTRKTRYSYTYRLLAQTLSTSDVGHLSQGQTSSRSYHGTGGCAFLPSLGKEKGARRERRRNKVWKETTPETPPPPLTG